MNVDELARAAGQATKDAARDLPMLPIGAVRGARRRRAVLAGLAAAAVVLAIGLPLALLPTADNVAPGATVVAPTTTVAPTTPTTEAEPTPTTLPPTTAVPEPSTTVPTTTMPPPVAEGTCNLTTHDGHEIPTAVVQTCTSLYTLVAAQDVAGLDTLTGADFIVTIFHVYVGPGWQAAVDVWDEGNPQRSLSDVILESLSFTPRPTADGRYYWPGWLNILDWYVLTPTEQEEVLTYFETTVEEIEAPGFFTVEQWFAELFSEKPFWVVIDQDGTILFVGHEGS